MKNNFKSKIIVISFFAFVVSIYSASYFYTKNNNERLLASPRIVMLVGAEAEKNNQLLELTDDQRRDDIRLLNAEKKLFVLSQTQFNDGITDIIEYYAGQYIGEKLTVADCMGYSEKLERAMIKTENKALKSSWIFSACGLIP